MTGLLQWVWVALLASVHHRSGQIGTIWCQAAYTDTTGRVHQSYVRPSLIAPGSPNHTEILCTCVQLQLCWSSKPWPSVTSSSSFLACNSRLRSAIRRHHPPQRAVLSQICCFGERKMVMFQILLDDAEPCDAGTTQLSSPICRSNLNSKL